LGDDEKYIFQAPPKETPFLKNDSRDKSGEVIFSKLKEPIVFEVTGWSLFTDQKGEQKPMLELLHEDGSEFLFVLGPMNESTLYVLGVRSPDELVGKSVAIQTFKTGSTGAFAVGKEIISVE
jgi:hypothetical protein